MEVAIERLAIAMAFIIGLSHILQARAWAEFFQMLRSKGEAGSFINGFLSLTFGALVVGFHNVWSGPGVVLTVLGWAQLLKAGFCFWFPRLGLRSMAMAPPEQPWKFTAAGVVLLAVGGVLVYAQLARA
jgi:hypothetical protein